MLLRIITIFENSSNRQLFGPLTSDSLFLPYVVVLTFWFGLLHCWAEYDFLVVITFRSTAPGVVWTAWFRRPALHNTGPALPDREQISSVNPNSSANQWEAIYRMTNSASPQYRAQAVSNVITYSSHYYQSNPHSSYQCGGKLLTLVLKNKEKCTAEAAVVNSFFPSISCICFTSFRYENYTPTCNGSTHRPSMLFPVGHKGRYRMHIKVKNALLLPTANQHKPKIKPRSSPHSHPAPLLSRELTMPDLLGQKGKFFLGKLFSPK